MARKPQKARKATLQEQPLELDEERTPEEAADDAEEDILHLLDAQPEGASIKITVLKLFKRPAGGTPEEVQIFTAQREDLQEGLWDRLRDTYGSGTYRVRVRRRLPGQRETIARQIDRAVMLRPGTPEPGAAIAPPASAPAIATPAPGDLGAAIAGALAGVLDRQAAMFAQLVDKIAPKQGGMKEIVETLSALDALRGGKEPPPNPMEFVKMGMELVRDAAPGEKGIADVAASFIQSGVLERFADMLANRQAPTTTTGAQPAHQLQPPPANRAPPPPPAHMAYLMELVGQVAQLAAQVPQPDVAEVADFLDYNAPQSMLVELVQNDSLFEQLAQLPAIARHRGFFVALRANLAAGMVEGEKGESDANQHADESATRPAAGNA